MAVDERQQRPWRTGWGNVWHPMPAAVPVGPVQPPGSLVARVRRRRPTQLGDRAAAPPGTEVRPPRWATLHDGDVSSADTRADLDLVAGMRRDAPLAVARDLAKMQLRDGRQRQRSLIAAWVGGTVAAAITLSAPEPNNVIVHITCQERHRSRCKHGAVSISWVGDRTPCGVSAVGLPVPARRTRRAPLSAPGSPRVVGRWSAGGGCRWWLPMVGSRGSGWCCRGSGSG